MRLPFRRDRPSTSLNFERHGQGEPLVLLHGIGGELCVWEPVLARAIAYDATNEAMLSSNFTGAELINVPLTVAFGELDRLIRPVRLDVPGARMVMLPGCGHIPMWDDPERVTELSLATASAGAPAAVRSLAG